MLYIFSESPATSSLKFKKTSVLIYTTEFLLIMKGIDTLTGVHLSLN